MTMANSVIKGFKHLRPGVEVAVLIKDKFGYNPRHVLRTISEVDYMAGIVRLNGTACEFGFDGMEIGHMSSEPRQRLIVPVPDDVRHAIWRREAREKIEALLKAWEKLDDEQIRAIVERLP